MIVNDESVRMWSEAIMANVKELRQLYQVAISTTLKNFA
jgi:hypothetical protein